jgi:sulfur carrier protein
VVNGKEHLVPAGTTLLSLVERVGAARRGIAVAMDGEVVARSAWASAAVGAGSRVEIVSAAAGG